MYNGEIARYIGPKAEKMDNGIGAGLLKDCFELVAPLVMDMDCYVFLIDGDRCIIAAYNRNGLPGIDSLTGRTMEFPFDFEKETGETVKPFYKVGVKGGDSFYIHRPDRAGDLSEGCFLCAVVQDEAGGMEYRVLLKKLGEGMGRAVRLMNRYREQAGFLMRALNAVEEGISAVDKDGLLVYANDACCNIIGASKEEILFQNIGSLAETRPILLDILENGKSIIDVEYFLNVKGNVVHLINSGYPVFDGNGDIIGAIDIFRGIKRSTKLASNMAGYKATFEFADIIGQSSTIREKVNLAKIFARSNENVLIQGESGTGKELFAQSIHNYSYRKQEPFVAINCANFPNDLMDSELFGYEEGAFTGAQKGGRQGKFELANGGTLFLDEIGEMQLHLQAKLLRVVETKTINRIGGNRPISVDVRIIAATNRDLEAMVNKGKFRKDLYYRLKVHFIEIPSLRERKEDILLLVDHFVEKLGRKMHKEIKGIDSGARKVLLSHDWPGNLRELENTISSALYICDSDRIREEHLPLEKADSTGYNIVSKGQLQRINKEMVLEALKITRGNKKRAAEMLGISRPTVYRILRSENVK